MSEHTWIALTADMAKAGLEPGERAALASGEMLDPNPQLIVDGLVEDVVAEIRMGIASGGRSKLSSDGSLIPHGLKPTAIALLRFRILTRFSVQVTQARTDEWTAANDTLKALRRGELSLPSPDGGPEAPAPTPSPHYSGRPVRWGPRTRRGIM